MATELAMTFPDAVRRGLRNYATFTGRARRSEFWFFWLFNLLLHMAAAVLDAAILGDGTLLNSLVSLGLLLPNVAVSVRRLHDVGRSGWWLLIGLVPLVGIVVLLLWYTARGEEGANRFGPDPRGVPLGGPQRPWPARQ
jgi:uncharacterized membrane protein YhaH (DUF805 family)